MKVRTDGDHQSISKLSDGDFKPRDQVDRSPIDLKDQTDCKGM